MERAPAILIVDAEAPRGEAMVMALGSRSIRARCVTDARDAARALCREEYALVVVSAAKPAPIVRNLRIAAPATPLLVVGECRDWATVVELAALGAMDLVSPAAGADELARRIRKVLRGAAA